MSYIRAGYPLAYVDAKSKDYVYSNAEKIEDYGSITDDGMIELLFKNWNTEDEMFKEHLMKRLSERLNVIIRSKPLTWDDKMEIMRLERE